MADGVTARCYASPTLTFTLKTTRDGWVRGAYKAGTPEALARTTLARAPGA